MKNGDGSIWSSSPLWGVARVGVARNVQDQIAFEDGLQLLEDLIVPETPYPEALRMEPGGALLILFGSDRVLTPVQLDNQTSFEAGEIRDVTTDRRLPAESGPVDLAMAQVGPQATARASVECFRSELPGEYVGHTRKNPSP